MRLDELPAEVQHAIIRYTDAIGLISLSQASSYFRRVIKPSKKHFAERLLAIESIPDHGGTPLVLVSRTSTLTPNWPSPAWDAMRWACTECLRLLSHHHFNNHSLLGLAYRKPASEAPAATLITSWEPSVPRKHRDRRYQPVVNRNGIPETHRQLYHMAITCPIDIREGLCLAPYMEAMEQLQGITYGEFQQLNPSQQLKSLDQFALLYERQYCGYGRRLRKCNECRYQSGQLRPQPFPLGGVKITGTTRVPVVLSRTLVFGCPLDRYFPGISEVLGCKRPQFDPIVFRVLSDRIRGESWRMYMARCPRCSQWQEIREFRIGGLYNDWRPTIHEQHSTWDERPITASLLDDLCCNKCLAKAYGLNEFTKYLQLWIEKTIERDLEVQTRMLLYGFRRVRRLHVIQLEKNENQAVEMGELWSIINPMREVDFVFDENGIATLTDCYERLLHILPSLPEADQTAWAPEDMRIQAWFNNFGQTKEFWEWLSACKDRVEGKKEAVAEWILRRDGAAFT